MPLPQEIIDFLYEIAEAYRYFNPIAYSKFSDAAQIVSSARTVDAGIDQLNNNKAYYLSVIKAINQFKHEGDPYYQQLLADIRRSQFIDVMSSLPGITVADAEKYADEGVTLEKLWPSFTKEQRLGYYYYLQTISPLTDSEFINSSEMIVSLLKEDNLTGSVIRLDNPHNSISTGYHIIVVKSTKELVDVLNLFEKYNLIVVTYQLKPSSWHGLIRLHPQYNSRPAIIKMVNPKYYSSYVVYKNTHNGEAAKYIGMAARTGRTLTKRQLIEDGQAYYFDTPEELIDYLNQL
jgi:hypothetical protein